MRFLSRKRARRRNLTKSQRVSRRRKASVERRVATALKKFVQAQNPGKKLAGAIVQRMAGGVVKITPIKANPKKDATWTVDAWHGGGGIFRTRKQAEDHANRLRAANRQAGNVGPVKVRRLS